MSTYIKKFPPVIYIDISIDQATSYLTAPPRASFQELCCCWPLRSVLAWLGGAKLQNEREAEDYKKFGYLSGRIMGNDMSGGEREGEKRLLARHLGVMICIPTFGATRCGMRSCAIILCCAM